MRLDALVVFLYGIIVFAGGLIGYTLAGSLPSIIMGFVFSVILIGSSIGLWKKRFWGFLSGIAASVILTIFFMTRFIVTSKFFPGGAVALLSFIVMVLLISTRNDKQLH